MRKVPSGFGKIYWIAKTDQKLFYIYQKMNVGTNISSYIKIKKEFNGLNKIHWINGTDQKLFYIY